MKFIQGLLFVFLLAGCGQTATIQDDPADSRNAADPTPSCPEFEVDGQTLDEVPEKEMKRYTQKLDDMPDAMSDAMSKEEWKKAMIQSERKETFQAKLKQEGMTMEDLMDMGSMLVNETSVVIQLKKDLPEEERESMKRAVEKVREMYNEDAVLIDEVSISRNEKNERITEVVDTLKKHDTIGEKLSGVGSCGGGSMDIRATFLEEPEGGEIDYIGSAFDYKVYVEVSAMETSGYVTRISDGEMLVDFTWFSGAPEDIAVGDYVKVTHGAVAESFPAQSGAYKTEIKEPRQPDGADKTDRQAVREALASFEKGPLDVMETTYDEGEDEWQVTVTTGIMEEDEEETVTVPD